ncbi:MAG: hypothetical protein IJ996_04460 [Clostridia bacterium]|nr:hypothetical protein [Clostridia bacterium]
MQDMDVVDDFEDVPQRVKKSGGFLGKLIAVLLGLIIGVMAGAGGIVGIGYILVAKTKIKTNMNTVNGFVDPDINYADYINGKYGEETLVTLVGDTIAAIQSVAKSEGSLNTLNEISPLIGKMVVGEDGNSGLVKLLQDYYIAVEPDKIMDLIVVKPNGAETDPNKYLLDYVKEKVNDVPVADFLIKLGYPLNDTLLAIACGIEGIQWEKNADGTITMLNGHKQLTLKEFLSEDLTAAIYRLPLDAIMPISLTDKVMMMLVYGDEFCYHTEDKNGKSVVVMNQIYYTYDTVSGKLYTARGEEVDPTTISDPNFASGTCTVQVDAETVHYLQAEDMAGDTITLYAYSTADCTDDVRIYYPKTTINDLQSGAVNLVEDMYLKDVLDIGIGSDRMLLSLAYGVENVDYKIVEENGTQKIVSIHPPRTIGDLRDYGEDLIYEIYLRDVIDAEPDDKITMYILYGKEDLHYSVGSGDVITMLQKQVAVVGDTVYNEYGDVLIGTLDSNSFTENGKTYTLSTATGKTLTTVDNTTATLYYVVDENGEPVNFPYITLGDLKGNSPILENISTRLTLADVLADNAFDGHTILSKLKDITIKDLPTKMESMTVGEIYGDENVLLKALQDTPLEQLGDAVDSLTVGELFGDRDPVTGEYLTDENGNIVISNNPILNALSPTKIIHLEERAKQITIGEIIPGAKDNKVLKHLQTSTFASLDSDVEALKFGDVFYDDLWEVYDEAKAGADYKEGTGNDAGFAVDASGNRIMKSIWKYMLYENVETADTTTIPDYYVVTQTDTSKKDVNDMMSNMTSNLQSTHLSFLIDDGLITFGSNEQKEKFLKSYVLTNPSDPTSKIYLKNMTIVDMLNHLADNSLQD